MNRSLTKLEIEELLEHSEKLAFNMLKTFNEIPPMLGIIKRNEDGTIDKSMGTIEFIFHEKNSKKIRNLLLYTIIAKEQPIAVILINEAWSIRERDVVPGINPSESSERIDCFTINFISDEENILKTFDITSDFTQINEDGEPLRTANLKKNSFEKTDIIEYDAPTKNTVKSIFKEIFDKACKDD